MRRGVPAATRAWVARQTGGQVVRAARLRGGITSSVHRLTVRTRGGKQTSVVLRRWTDADPRERVEAVRREARVLQLLERTDIPAPRLLAVSEGDETDGVAAVLMSRVPGRMDLTPSDPDAWLRQMAATLTRIQALNWDFPAYEPRPRPKPDAVPAWVERPSVWRDALTVVQSPPPKTTPCFTHGDFQHFNVLWSRGRLSGVVDWVDPVVSSPDVDVAHCRLNLTILYGPELAERFRHAYEAEAGRRVEPWWDLQRLTGYGPDWQQFIPLQVAGRAPVDIAGMTRRVEQSMESALSRLS